MKIFCLIINFPCLIVKKKTVKSTAEKFSVKIPSDYRKRFFRSIFTAHFNSSAMFLKMNSLANMPLSFG